MMSHWAKQRPENYRAGWNCFFWLFERNLGYETSILDKIKGRVSDLVTGYFPSMILGRWAAIIVHLLWNNCKDAHKKY